MSRVGTFTRRNLLEMSRDTLSYIFCIAFPLVMLVIMTIVNASIPKNRRANRIRKCCRPAWKRKGPSAAGARSPDRWLSCRQRQD